MSKYSIFFAILPHVITQKQNAVSMDLKAELTGLLKGEVLDDEATLAADSYDASIFEIRPRMVVRPRDVEDLRALVAFASSRRDSGVSLTMRSAGTDMTGGAIGESVIVEMVPYFNHIKEIGDGYAVTEPGVFYRDFEKETLQKGYFLPPYPASREICTVGGMAANNSGGEKSLRYGKTENFVQQLKVVLRDGQEHALAPLDKAGLETKMAQQDLEGDIYRRMYSLIEDNYDAIMKAKPDVSKNSAGYYLWNVWDRTTFDLTKLLVGSQGTLGIISEIRYRLVKPDLHSKLLVMFLRDLRPLPGIINAILKHGPESFESYDDYTLKFAVKYSAEIMRHMGRKNIFSLLWGFLPEFWMVLTGGLPKQVMLAEFTGATEEEVDAKIRAAEMDIRPFGVRHHITRTESEARKYWLIRRESFNLFRKHFKKERTAPFIDDFCVTPAQLPEFLPKLYSILDRYKLTLTVVGHMGDANFHIIPIMDFSKPETKKVITSLSKEVYDLVFSYGGSMTGEHNDGLVRSPYLKEMYGPEIYGLFEEVKRIFDPDSIFNPGKKVGATVEYAMAHMKKS